MGTTPTGAQDVLKQLIVPELKRFAREQSNDKRTVRVDANKLTLSYPFNGEFTWFFSPQGANIEVRGHFVRVDPQPWRKATSAWVKDYLLRCVTEGDRRAYGKAST
jgi:hypothetical protein